MVHKEFTFLLDEAHMLSRIRSWLCARRRILLFLCGVFGAYLLMFALGITCPIKFLTGVSCPGCGLTRACVSALCLRFADAFAYHPLFWLVPVALVLLALEKRSRVCRIAFYSIVGIAVAVYAVRMADPSDTVVVFAPQDGALVRAAEHILSLLKK